jgi:hypothetical protein
VLADIKSILLHGNLKEDIWMLPSPGICLSGKILHLKKSLYSLKQASNEWYNKLSSVLLEKGFIATHFNPYVFIYLTTPTILVVYLDNITAAGTCENINDIFSFLSIYFDLTIKHQVQWILKIEIQQTKRAITLSQEQYIDKILTRCGLSDCHSVTTLIDSKCELTQADKNELIYEQNLYQQMIGSLMYLVTCIYPDLAFTVSFLSQFSSQPTTIHHSADKRVFRYIKDIPNYHLTDPRNGSLQLTGYSNASYTNCISTQWS